MTSTEYAKIRTTGRPAEARIHGTLRGGFVLDGIFYAHAGSRGVVSAPVAQVTDLRLF